MRAVGATKSSLRILCVVAVVAALLVPAWIHPVRAMSFPTTLSKVLTTSGAGRASLSFAATHVAFSWTGEEGTGVSYRTISQEQTSKWRRARESHDMEHGNQHYSGVTVVYRPDAIEWRPVEPPGTDVERIRVHYLNTLDGPRRTVEVPATAAALASEPDVITRAEWGADESLRSSSGACRRTFYRPRQIFVHHTAGTNDDPRPRATMRAILAYHTQGRGWCDIAYNFVIGPDGQVFEGRYSRRFDPWETHDGENRDDEIVTGAHTYAHNSGSIGVSLMGDYTNRRLPLDMRRGLVATLAWKADRHNLDPTGTHTYRNPDTGLTRGGLFYIAGHRDVRATACPGNRVYRALPDIRQEVAAMIGAGKQLTKFRRFRSADPSTSPGEPVVFRGKLETRGGKAVAGRALAILTKPSGRRWRESLTAVTDNDGRFRFALALNQTSKVVTLFEGDVQLWGSQSVKLTQTVE